MSCQRSRLTQPHMVLTILATLPFLFVTHAWAAPHSHSHFVKRDSSTGGGSKIVVCLSISDHIAPLNELPNP